MFQCSCPPGSVMTSMTCPPMGAPTEPVDLGSAFSLYTAGQQQKTQTDLSTAGSTRAGAESFLTICHVMAGMTEHGFLAFH